MKKEFFLLAKKVTAGDHFHFFGYYDKSPWALSRKCLLALEVDFMDRPPAEKDKARICLIEEETNKCEIIGETSAWNWQQGCMLQWLPGTKDKIIYNDRKNKEFFSVILDIKTGKKEEIPFPIYTLSHNGKKALTLNFSRLQDTRPGYGYPGIPGPFRNELTPKEDGIYLGNLEKGEKELTISLSQLYSLRTRADMEGAKHWVNHLLFNTDDSRFIFLHRWEDKAKTYKDKGTHLTRMLTSDSKGIYLLSNENMVSHFDWRDEKYLLAWAMKRKYDDHYYLFKDLSPEFEIVGEKEFSSDGHCSYSPDRKYVLTDTYPDSNRMRTLILYRLADNKRIDIGNFFSPPELTGEIRCDLHPRWSRDGKQVCIDSVHEGSRQIYILDVSGIVGE